MAAIKWDIAYWVAPTIYSTMDAPSKRAFNRSINMIDDNSPAGRVLRGLAGGQRIQFSNPFTHAGTDDNNLDHINFRFTGTGAPGGEYHLYPDGTYTTPGPPATRQTFAGNPLGDPAPPAPPAQAPLSGDDFPALGGSGSGEGKKK